MKRIALIDYGSGNLHSAERALMEAASRTGQDCEISVTSDPLVLQHSDAIVLPGVGHFADCATNLRVINGLVDALEEAVLNKGKPFLGICVGMQLLADVGLEDGETPGLGWIAGKVEKIDPGPDYRIRIWAGTRLRHKWTILCSAGSATHHTFTSCTLMPCSLRTPITSQRPRIMADHWLLPLRETTSSAHSFTRKSRKPWA